MTDIQTTVIVTAVVASNVREISRRLRLDGMFVRALSATGNLPATHFISSGLIRPAYLNVMTDSVRLFTAAKAAWESDGDVFPFTQAQVTTALAACVVHDGQFNGNPEGPHALLERLGLKLVGSALP